MRPAQLRAHISVARTDTALSRCGRLEADAAWLARPDESVLGVGGQSSISRGRLLGMLAVVSRSTNGATLFGLAGELIVQAKIGKRWGIGPLFSQGLGLARSVSPLRLAKFLIATDFDVPIRMPRRTAEHYQVPIDYTSNVRKGLAPTAIRSWPWDSEDSIEFGRARKPTGCEDNNAHAILNNADYTPTIVT